MAFKVAARTIFHLGAELISSDSIAFYELIKNAIDASANDSKKKMLIDVVVRIEYDKYVELHEMVNERYINSPGKIRKESRDEIVSEILRSLNNDAPDIDEYIEEIQSASFWKDILNVLEEANYIIFKDFGCGMSIEDLDNIYLTIGTPVKAMDTTALGEKGIGRLSVMRLGDKISVKTRTTTDRYWNKLDIDWRIFNNPPEDNPNLANPEINDYVIEPYKGNRISQNSKYKTIIKVTALKSKWRMVELKNIVEYTLSRIYDPFSKKDHFQVLCYYNDNYVVPRKLEKQYLQAAHANFIGEYKIDEIPRFVGKTIHYEYGDDPIEIDESDLETITETSTKFLKNMGEFSVEFYWFNRQKLKKIDGLGTRKEINDWVNHWAGGIMIFRDGYRVLPFGQRDDDWLNLDQKALRSPGYKVNRSQLIGKVDISREENPALIDQANREGLKDTSEKKAFVNILIHLMENHFRRFLNDEYKRRLKNSSITIDVVEDRYNLEEKDLKQNLRTLKSKYDFDSEDEELFKGINEHIKNFKHIITETKKIAEKYEQDYSQYLHLAGIGLMIEVIAHELNRSTKYTIDSLTYHLEKGSDLKDILSPLKEQLKTIQKRISRLDPLSTAGRQVKMKFDLVQLVEQIKDNHLPRLKRHSIKFKITARSENGLNKLKVKMVKGMFIQIFENLIDNSIYWLRNRKEKYSNFKPEIEVEIDLDDKSLTFADNGKGISESNRNKIFSAFFTTKPPGQGKGLGLYISKEIAKYNDCKLELLEENTIRENSYNTFILEFGGADASE